MRRLLLALVVASSLTAHADTFDVLNMPDFDQERNYYQNVDHGSMFCAPTSAIDLLHYLSTHGFPHLFPWPNTYDGVTQAIYDMSVIMDTDKTIGTSGSNPSTRPIPPRRSR